MVKKKCGKPTGTSSAGPATGDDAFRPLPWVHMAPLGGGDLAAPCNQLPASDAASLAAGTLQTAANHQPTINTTSAVDSQSSAPGLQQPAAPDPETKAKALHTYLAQIAPVLKDKVSEADLVPLAAMSDEDAIGNINNLASALSILKEKKLGLSFLKVMGKAGEILAREPWSVYQLLLIVEMFGANAPSDPACDMFLGRYIPTMDKKVRWKEFLEEVMRFDATSMIAKLGPWARDFDDHVRKCEEAVVSASEVLAEWMEIPQLVLGKAVRIEAAADDHYCTTIDGKIRMPAFESTFPTRPENLRTMDVSLWHELGHHRWKSFQVNMDPGVFDYSSFGIEYVRHRREEGERLVVTVRVVADGKEIEIRDFSQIAQLVKKPRLLDTLHNILDDKRVDTNNMERLEGKRREYREDLDALFIRRPELRNDKFETLMEAILQYATIGRLRNELPAALAPKFGQIKQIIDAMETGMHTDGTDSMNAAIKVYRLIENDSGKDDKRTLAIRPSKTNIHRPGSSPKMVAEPRGQRIPIDDMPGLPGRPDEGSNTSEPTAPKPGDTPGKKPDGIRQSVEKKESAVYDGWDGERTVLNEHAVSVYPAEGPVFEPPPDEVARIKRIFDKYVPKQGVLERGTEDGEVDPELLLDYLERVRYMQPAEPTYFSQVVREVRDVATGVLVDLSGSTQNIRPQIYHACSILGTASQHLGDPLTIAGFTTGEGSSEEYVEMLGMDEREIKTSTKGGGTPMGGPLRHMCHVISTTPTSKRRGYKQIFIISDGETNVGKAPLEDAAKAVEEAWNKKKIRVFGIGIAEDNPEAIATMNKYFEKIFGFGHYLVVTKREVEDGELDRHFEQYYRRVANKKRRC